MSIKQAIAAYQSGDTTRTEQLCAALLDRQPGNGAAWELRGLATWQNGNGELAIEYLRNAVRVAPRNPTHLFNLGRILFASGQLETAAANLESVLQLAPRDHDAMTLLGNIHLRLGNLKEALRLQLQAVKIQPGNPVLLNNLGLVQVRLRDLAKALENFKRAWQLAPDSVEIARNVAMYSEMTEPLREAQTVLDGAIAHWPDDPTLNLVATKIRLRAGEIDEALNIISRFQSLPDDSELACEFAFQKATALEAAKDFAAAFVQFETANRMTRKRLASQPLRAPTVVNINLIDDLIRYYSSNPSAGDAVEIADAWNDPIFVVGMPRSGTTLLDTILGSGLQAHVLEEEGAVFRVITSLGDLQINYPDELHKLDAATVNNLRKVYFENIETLIPDSATGTVVDKMPFNLVHVGLLMKVFPGARFVRALRHPADVLISNFKQNYDDPHSAQLFSELGQILDIAEKFQELWELQVRHQQARATSVRFEELITDTGETANALFKFLGFPGARLDEEARQRHAQEKLKRVAPNYSAVTARLGSGNVSNWQNYAAALEPYMERLSTLATKQGYGRLQQ